MDSIRVAEDPNINGRQGNLRRRPLDASESNEQAKEAEREREVRHINPRSGARPSVRPNAMRNRDRQLDALKQMEERIQQLKVNNVIS